MSDILNQYKVKFSTPIKYPKHNRLDTVDDVLTVFIEDHYTINEATKLLDSTKYVLSNNIPQPIEFYTQSLYLAAIDSLKTKIYENMDTYVADPNSQPDYMLPTTHFLIIVEAWKNFLIQAAQLIKD